MKRFISAILILAVSLSLVACGSKPFSENPDAIDAASKSVVEITVYDKSNTAIAGGSGFFAFDSKTIITNYHVIENAYKIEIIDDDDNTVEVATIYNVNKDKDIAILQIEKEGSYSPLKVSAAESLKKGESVVAIGSPLGLKNTISKGTISNFVEQDGIDMIQFTAAISHGSSGGALINDSGEVIGSTSGSYVDGQNLNLAIPAAEITDLYEDKPISMSVVDYYNETVIPTINAGVLTIGVSADCHPYEYIDNSGNITGIEVEIAREVANRLGLKAEFVNMEFENLLSSLIDEKVDCVIGMAYEPLRLEYVNASNPMFTEDLGDGLTFVSVMYITKTNTDLQSAVNNTIREMQEDGTIAAILGN